FNPIINIFNENYNILSNEYELYINVNIKSALDSKGSTILFYKLGSIIPLKVDKNYLHENILSLSKYILSKEFNQ
ncbi:MAG: hypothetical protein ACRCYC_17120, partial [Paraclostridium sp.]|uniref:hypothetical protein n=1 Tax=Paraclostridium sp. TaxID=2023273 RepID=UPI003F3F61AD